MRRASLLCLAVLLAATPAAAQLSRLVVPGDGGPVIAPRGQPSPRLAARPLPALPPVADGTIFIPAGAATPLAAPAMALLPMIAAAVLGGSLAGSSSGGSGGPVRTR
ncbi:hypothetical protein C8P66_12154 [Humitalea rosea]|uniref:Uncharacterized protein n=1 Tax=Humitalea rosea TaxID=990373 RepID=A0A2W7IPL5_9PROT|nr:hypothetical protein [Humitalea rosea]PZW41347.1 hypothetical protein C8P66_12154 [Humitalea rosea]